MTCTGAAVGVNPARLNVLVEPLRFRAPETVRIWPPERFGREITAEPFQLRVARVSAELTTRVPPLSATAPLPRALALAVAMPPPESVVPPEYALLRESVVVPFPDTLSDPAPMICPVTARRPLLVRVTVFEMASVVVIVLEPARLASTGALLPAFMVIVPPPVIV